MHVNANYARMHAHIALEVTKIIVSIHWTLLSNFNFLHHPQIMFCLKAIDKYRNVHMAPES